ncbi:MAG: peptide deformylase [Candidatus Omnitrophota bacterium]
MNEKTKNNILKIYKYGEEVLRIKSADIQQIDDKLIELIDQMTVTLHRTPNAVGLAAPQIGQPIRVSVIDLSQGQDPNDLLVLINPEILEAEGRNTLEEGCLSLPGISASVNRHTRILLRHTDRSGKEIRREIEGFLARAVQHEVDHLDGTLIIDRVSSLKRQLLKKEIKRLQEDGEW